MKKGRHRKMSAFYVSDFKLLQKIALKFIKEQENWTFVSGYVDEGISGTSVNKREEFPVIIYVKDGVMQANLFSINSEKMVNDFIEYHGLNNTK